MILWSCKRFDSFHFRCAFFYSGGEFDVITFKIGNEKELVHVSTHAIPMYPGMIPRRAHLLQNDLLFIYFSKRYSEVGSRHDDHKGFYAYKLEENGKYTILGGAGSDHIGYNQFCKENGGIRDFYDGVIFRMKDKQIGYLAV